MTGGTLDLWNDPKGQIIPVPDGYGTIINSGSWSQSGLQIKADGLDHDFHGVITDGNNGVLNGDNTAGFNAGQGPGYQIGIVNASGTSSCQRSVSVLELVWFEYLFGFHPAE